ncbi:MAG: histidine--tRNA ligase [Candidatus Aenigmatarchaeota archaeon]
MTNFQPAKGTRDIPPEEMRRLLFVFDKCRNVFEKYGFVPLETPAFENFELLAAKGGEAVKEEVYYFKDKGGRELGLRFDLTVGMARFIANNPNIQKPFKRYAFGKVWRYDNPQAMRWREFYQLDVDVVGSQQVEADAECLACFCECLDALGIKGYYIRVNNRNLLKAFLVSKGVLEKNMDEWFRTIDKLDKIGKEGVEKELLEKKFDKKTVKDVIASFDSKLEKFSKTEGYEELSKLIELAKSYGISEKIKFDLSLIRGLEYYTGLVFEIGIEGIKVSLGGGGRYDKMIKAFGGPDLPATGISFGLSRLIQYMEEKNLFSLPKNIVKVFAANVDEKSKEYAVETAQKLRKAGIDSETDLMGKKLGKQLEYAAAAGIPFVAIIGADEIKQKSAKLRNMKTGKEEMVNIEKLAEELKEM